MSRAKAVGERDVRVAYGQVKTLMPTLAPLKRDDFVKSWTVGQVTIGNTCREAYQLLRGMKLGVQFYGVGGGK